MIAATLGAEQRGHGKIRNRYSPLNLRKLERERTGYVGHIDSQQYSEVVSSVQVKENQVDTRGMPMSFTGPVCPSKRIGGDIRVWNGYFAGKT